MSEYSGPIIDAHTHLWDLADDRYPWLRKSGSFGPKGRLDALKGKNYLLEDFLRDIEGTGVEASVHVEALWDPDNGRINETIWLDSLGDARYAARYIAGVDFGKEATKREIAAQASHERVRGVRQVLSWTPHPDRRMVDRPHIAREDAWREAIPVLLEHDLHLEVLLYPNQAVDIAELAQEFPDLVIVVNHMASPIEQDAAGLQRWRAAITTMGAEPNVLMKISAAAAYLEEKTATAVRPFLEHVLEGFGAERVMFGSDFPVGTLTGLAYPEYLDIYRSALGTRSPGEQVAIFHDNAKRVYRF